MLTTLTVLLTGPNSACCAHTATLALTAQPAPASAISLINVIQWALSKTTAIRRLCVCVYWSVAKYENIKINVIFIVWLPNAAAGGVAAVHAAGHNVVRAGWQEARGRGRERTGLVLLAARCGCFKCCYLLCPSAAAALFAITVIFRKGLGEVLAEGAHLAGSCLHFNKQHTKYFQQ